MKNYKVLKVLVILITILASIATLTGIFMNDGPGSFEFETLRSGTVTIYGVGLYKHETSSLGSQTRAQDLVTLIICIPLLIISFRLAKNNSLKWRLLFTGTLGYFMYTYAMFSLIAYNEMFLVYVALFPISLYAFIISMSSYDLENLRLSFKDNLPRGLISGYLIFSGVGLAIRWLADIINSLISGGVPSELAHYTTPLVYALDLSIAVPTFFVAAILLIKRSSYGYLLASIMIIKGITMWIALTAMTISLVINGIEMSTVDIAMAPVFAIITIGFLVILIKAIKSNTDISHSNNIA